VAEDCIAILAIIRVIFRICEWVGVFEEAEAGGEGGLCGLLGTSRCFFAEAPREGKNTRK